MAHTHKMLNAERIALTSAEIAALDARDAAWVEPSPRATTAVQSNITTAEQKLARLGLSVAELKELLGR